MAKIWLLVLCSMAGSMGFAACTSPVGAALATPVPSASPSPTTVNKVMPTPSSPGQVVHYGDLQAAMSQAEVTTSYLTDYGSTRVPPAGKKFLWIQITLQNNGQNMLDLPAPEHFSVLNGETEFKPIYGHRKDHVDYLTLTSGLVQGQAMDAWLRFDIPSALELKDLWFAFLPESSQISVGFSPSNYPAGDHPIYLWNCAPK